ncbi:MAG: BolA family transcriptional regulator [Rhodobacteraceae bacterium]|nr:BolA family transcriptional regulator [Paracoccaceae bacterium]
MYSKLSTFFQPEILEVENQSHLHKGHVGWNETGETHFHIRISSAKFENLNRIQRHRLLHTAITPELMSLIHALSIEILPFGE